MISMERRPPSAMAAVVLPTAVGPTSTATSGSASDAAPLTSDGIFDDVDAEQQTALAQPDGHGVDAPGHVLQRLGLQVVLRRGDHVRLLTRGDGLFRRAKALATARAHFDEHPSLALPCDQVDLAVRAAIVAADHTVAVPGEVQRG